MTGVRRGGVAVRLPLLPVLPLLVALLVLSGCTASSTPDRHSFDPAPGPSAGGSTGSTPGAGTGTSSGTSSGTGSGTGQPAPTDLRVAAIGDSVTSGAACGCAAFASIYGRLLRARWDVPVAVDNEGLNGQDSQGLLDELDKPGSTTARTVAESDVVLVTIGANDFGDHHDDVAQQGCVAECLGDEVQQMQKNVVALLARVRALRGSRPTTVLVTGYWNVFEDGDVAKESFPDAGVEATQQLTSQANQALKSAAAGAHATYVDLAAAFRAAGTGSGGVTPLLAPDGDHPSAAGHQLIARTLLAAGLPTSTGG